MFNITEMIKEEFELSLVDIRKEQDELMEKLDILENELANLYLTERKVSNIVKVIDEHI